MVFKGLKMGNGRVQTQNNPKYDVPSSETHITAHPYWISDKTFYRGHISLPVCDYRQVAMASSSYEVYSVARRLFISVRNGLKSLCVKEKLVTFMKKVSEQKYC